MAYMPVAGLALGGAESFRNEHRAALAWLNERTNENTRFFAVEVSAVQIGDSPIAPLFTIVVESNNWQKTVRTSTSVSIRSETGEKYRDFWSLFLTDLHLRFPNWTNTRTPLAQNWMNLPAETSVANYAVVVTGSSMRVEIYFSSPDSDSNSANFEKVVAHKQVIEQRFGNALDWDDLPGKKACRISFSSNANINNLDDWEESRTWLVDNVGRLRSVIDELGGLPPIFRESSSKSE